MSKFGEISSPGSSFGFGQNQDEGDEGYTCYQYQWGKGTITINSPKPDPNAPSRITADATTVTIKANITHYCQCEETFHLTDGPGAFWVAPHAGGQWCSGSTFKFKWNRNITGGSCMAWDMGADILSCSSKGVIDIDSTISLAEFISSKSIVTNSGQTCVYYYVDQTDPALIAELIKCGAEVKRGIKGFGGDAVKLCFNVGEMAKCLAEGIFKCGGKKNKAAVMLFITQYMDKFMKDFSCQPLHGFIR